MRFRTVLALFLLAAVPAFSQGMPWKKQIALDANISLPGDDGGEGLGTGYGGAAAFYYQLLSRNTFISASIGYNTFPYDGSSSATLTVLPLLIGARYNFSITGFQPYIGLEFGAYFLSASASDGAITIDTETETEIGVQPKIGFRYPLSPGLDLDASVKYHIITSDPSFSIIAPGIGIAYTID